VFLGNMISKEEVNIDEKKVEAVRQLLLPKNLKEFSIFMGKI